MTTPTPKNNELPSEYSERLGLWFSGQKTQQERKRLGQYMTPLCVARFMAKGYHATKSTVRILDPGAGTGTLLNAICEQIVVQSQRLRRLEVVAYELDPTLIIALRRSLRLLQSHAGENDVDLAFEIFNEDFILAHRSLLANTESLFSANAVELFDVVIANPPYFKIPKNDARARATATLVHGQPNIYALFMGVSASVLSQDGKLIFIVPRSFTSGPYFRRFRGVFFETMRPVAIHSYVSRKATFQQDGVLQENIILTASKNPGWQNSRIEAPITMSSSHGVEDIETATSQKVEARSVIDFRSPNLVLRITASNRDLAILRTVDSWTGSLTKYGYRVSTGPVVPFRATRFLMHDSSEGNDAVPLLWMHNVRPMETSWPLTKNGKQQFMLHCPDSSKLLIPVRNYVLIRRFSAKEDKRRLIAAPMDARHFRSDYLGLENHLNYVYETGKDLPVEIAWGLAAVFNSRLLDQYFRMLNGNTQVSATELRAIPLPPLEDIAEIGRAARNRSQDPKDQSQQIFNLMRDIRSSIMIDVLNYEQT